jgi:hypothetical protein
MMRLALFGTAATLAAVAQAQAPALTAAPSTRATVTVNLTLPQGAQGTPATIRIDYGQPHLRGRRLHTPGLVPLDSVWRFGANEATALETGVDLVVGGSRVAKGKYSLYVLPSAAGWKLIINANTGQWGTEYDARHDVARVDLRKRTLASAVESLSIWLIPARTQGTPAGPPSGELRFAWGDAELSTDWRVP